MFSFELFAFIYQYNHEHVTQLTVWKTQNVQGLFSKASVRTFKGITFSEIPE